MLSRRVSLVAAGLLIAGLTGCMPTPAPTPTPTGFASEEEAFAAAEETLREYAAANNAIDLNDPETFEPVIAWTVDEENANMREDLTQMRSLGWVLEGTTSYSNFQGVRFDQLTQTVTATVCIDVSKAELVDQNGKSVVPADRPDRLASDLAFEVHPTSTGLAVARVDRNDGNGACEL